MASSELADLTEATTLASTDLLYTVVDPAGTPLDRKATVATLQKGVLRQVLPTLDTSAQMWGTPGCRIYNTGTGSPGFSIAMFHVDRPITVTAMMNFVTVGPAGNEVIRFGIWQHDPATGEPGNLVADLGTVAVNASATGLFSVSGSVTLTPGDYWHGSKQSAYFTCRNYLQTYVGVASTAGQEGPGAYAGPGTGAFGNAPVMTDTAPAGTFATNTLMRWDPA